MRRETHRIGRANPTRKRVFGGAWPPSSPVRCSAHARPCLLAPAERELLERVTGPLSRCPSSLSLILAAIGTYSASCARASANVWPLEVAMRIAGSRRVCCNRVRFGKYVTRTKYGNGLINDAIFALRCAPWVVWMVWSSKKRSPRRFSRSPRHPLDMTGTTTNEVWVLS